MPVTFVSMKILGPVMDRSTWLSAAKLTRASISYSFDQPSHSLPISNIALHKHMLWMFKEAFQVLDIARIRQLVEVHDPAIRVFGQDHTDEIAADKSGTACNQKSLHSCSRNRPRGTCHGTIDPSR